MKPSKLYITVLATASLVATAAAQAQSDTRSPASTMAASATGIARVTKDSVKNCLTAKDLIGAAVYDRAGEKIGDIADIDLQGDVPAALSTAFNTKNAIRSDNTPAMDRPRSSTASTKDLGTGTIYLSVGGLWGIGDDLVSVPTSRLSYNAAEERFELSANKADVVALAEQKTGDRMNDNYTNRSPSTSPTTAGKQSFAEEATRVQKALKSDPMVSAFATRVTVMGNGDTLELHGMVDNKEQQKKIVDAARRATSFDIDDKLDVRK